MNHDTGFLLSEIKRMQRLYPREDLPFALATYVEDRYYPKVMGEIPAVLEDYAPPRATNLDRIKEILLPYYDMTWEVVTRRSRKREIVVVRMKMMYFLRVRAKMPLVSIAEIFKMDHSSVIHCRDKLLRLMETDDHLRKEIEYLNSKI